MIENMDYIHACAYVGVISILVLLVPIVYNDIKYRVIPNWAIWALISINILPLYILYSEGLPLFYIMLSIIMMALFGLMYKIGAIKGGDVKILTVIAWACPLNPWNPNDTFFQIQFTIYLAATAVMWMIYVYFKNRRTDLFNRMTLWQKFNNYPRGSPWMVPIAIAFIITAVFG